MIELRGVTKCFSRRGNGDAVTAVRDISFLLPQAQTLCLIGTSGCGKSTTLKMINRLIEPTSGDLLLDGEDVRRLDLTALRRRIGYVIQQVGLFPHMTVADNIGLLPRLDGWPRERIDDRIRTLMPLVHLPYAEFAHRWPHELSGGQQQRVGVIRALALDPAHILMDEPFGALDPITREGVQDEFLRLQREVKKTIVLVTHDLAEAFKLGTQVGIMHAGAIVQFGTPDELMARPANAFVEDFLRSHVERGSVDRKTVMDALDKACPLPPSGSAVVHRSSTLREALSCMLDSDSAMLSVVDDQQRVLGVVTRKSLLDGLP